MTAIALSFSDECDGDAQAATFERAAAGAYCAAVNGASVQIVGADRRGLTLIDWDEDEIPLDVLEVATALRASALPVRRLTWEQVERVHLF